MVTSCVDACGLILLGVGYLMIVLCLGGVLALVGTHRTLMPNDLRQAFCGLRNRSGGLGHVENFLVLWSSSLCPSNSATPTL